MIAVQDVPHVYGVGVFERDNLHLALGLGRGDRRGLEDGTLEVKYARQNGLSFMLCQARNQGSEVQVVSEQRGHNHDL